MDASEAVSIQPPIPPSGKKYFTVAEANRALALVRRIAGDIVRDIRQLRELHTLCQKGADTIPSADQEEARRRYASLTDHVSELNEELDKVGCECCDYRLGAVDFPSWVNGREICLSWRVGEPSVDSWYELDGNYAKRRPITEIGLSTPIAGPAAE